MKWLQASYIALLVLVFSSIGVTSATAQAVSEYEVKAYFLYRFLTLIEGPNLGTATSEEYTIGILGDDPFGDAFEVIHGSVVNGRRVTVQRFSSLRALRRTDILYVCESEEDNLPAILEESRGRNVLTVSDMDNFTESGGMIRFFLEDSRVLFEVNLEETDQAQLHLPAGVLRLARIFPSPTP